MNHLNMIACVDANTWGIGVDNRLPYSCKSDMQMFKMLTWGHPVIMGRKTFESIQANGKEPLPNRWKIILTHGPVDHACNMDHSIMAVDLDDVVAFLKSIDYTGYMQLPVFVIGGQSIYTQLLPYCDRAYITKIYPFLTKTVQVKCDTFCPNLDDDPDWGDSGVLGSGIEPALGRYEFHIYKRKEGTERAII